MFDTCPVEHLFLHNFHHILGPELCSFLGICIFLHYVSRSQTNRQNAGFLQEKDNKYWYLFCFFAIISQNISRSRRKQSTGPNVSFICKIQQLTISINLYSCILLDSIFCDRSETNSPRIARRWIALSWLAGQLERITFNTI